MNVSYVNDLRSLQKIWLWLGCRESMSRASVRQSVDDTEIEIWIKLLCTENRGEAPIPAMWKANNCSWDFVIFCVFAGATLRPGSKSASAREWKKSRH
jgi:hypothetical protein